MLRYLWWLVIPIGALGAAIVTGGAFSDLTAPPKTLPVEIVARYPHDPGAFSQGLIVDGETLYEGTGKYGGSSLRKIDLKSGEIREQVPLDKQDFGEGITEINGRIYQLTWKEQVCLVYDKATLKLQGGLKYAGQGWGLTDDEKHLFMSDGSAVIQVLDPKNLKVVRRMTVRDGRRKIEQLNELEYVDGEIYANVWYQDLIARINPKNGQVIGWIDCSNVFPIRDRPDREHVLNGIAYDAEADRLFVTGKNWPQLFEIKVLE